MIKDDLKIMLEDLIPQLNKITIGFMTGVKTSSNLTKSVGFEVTDTGIALVANSYWYYVSAGRRPRTKKVPITALIDYIKRYGIQPRNGQTINQLAFAIQTSIYKQGINPKNYANKVIDATADLTEETTADVISESLADEIVDTMTTTPYATEV